jgi:hypothetical protein
MKRSLGQNKFFFHVPYFLKVYNNPMGYAVENVKKVKIQPTLMHSRTVIRFYEIHTPLTEAVLPDSGNYKTIVSLCYQLGTMKNSTQVAEF